MGDMPSRCRAGCVCVREGEGGSQERASENRRPGNQSVERDTDMPGVREATFSAYKCLYPTFDSHQLQGWCLAPP